jgi:hypothetical protein
MRAGLPEDDSDRAVLDRQARAGRLQDEILSPGDFDRIALELLKRIA